MNQKLFSFSEFEAVYESYGFLAEAEAIVPKATPASLQVVDTKTSEPKSDVNPFDALVTTFLEDEAKAEKSGSADAKGKSAPVEEAEEPEAKPEEAKKGEVSKPAVKIQKVVISKPTPLTKALSLKVMKLGEKSERVKEVQKVLGIEQTGSFDKKTDAAVRAFQKAHNLLVDGKVGVQTYGALLQVKKEITDMSEIVKMIEALGRLTPNIVLDPRFYGVTKNVTIITVNGVQYIVILPGDKAKEEIKKMENDGVLTAGFEWIKTIGDAAGKALVLTLTGLFMVPLVAATALIQGTVSVVKFVADGAISVLSNTVQGMVACGKWVGQGLWKGVEAVGDATKKLFTGIGQVVGGALKATGEGLAAFASAMGSVLVGSVQFLAGAVWLGVQAVSETAKAIWKGATSLYDAGKKAVQWVAAKGKEALNSMANTVKSGITFIKDATVALGNTVISGAKAAGKAVTNVIGTGLEYAGNLISGAGSWVKSIFESILAETGDPLFESLLLEMALA